MEVIMKINLSGAETEFSDISSESYRTYVFPKQETVTIESPHWLYVSKSGGHRLIDDKGFSHYIPATWIHLFWQVRDGQPAFVK